MSIISAFYSIKLKKEIGFTYILSVLSIIFILYLFGLFGMLKYGIYFIYFITFLLFLYDIKIFIKNNNILKKYILNRGIIIFTVLYLFLFCIHYGRLLSTWDEFNHWGDVVKVMFTMDNFATDPNSMSLYKSYPPAMALFQYFFLKTGNQYIEYQLFFSYQVVFVSMFLPYVCKIKDISKLIASIFIILLTPTILFENCYTTIYIDFIVGCFYAYIFLNIIFNNKYDLYFILNLCLSMFALVLMKDVGLFFTIILFIVLIVDLIFVKKKIKFIKQFFIKNKRYLFILFVTLLMILFAKMSWNLNIKLNGAHKMFSPTISFFDMITGDLGYRKTVIINFINALFSRTLFEGFISLDAFKLTLILLFSYLIVDRKKEYTKYSYCLFVGLGIYIVGLLLVYCMNFSEYEALNLASYERYLSIYFVAILLCISIFIIKNNVDKGNEIYFCLLILLFFVPILKIINIQNSIEDSIRIRSDYDRVAEYVHTKINKDDKVYIISQNSTGFDHRVLKYNLRPNQTNSNLSWSIGEKYYEEDRWTLEIKSNQWMNDLKDNYDYVYIFKCDEQFINLFSDVFENVDTIGSQRLYKVNKEKMYLEYVG